MKVIARSELLDVIVSVEDGAIKLTNTFEESSLHPVGEWLKVFKLWDLVFAGCAQLTLRTSAGHRLFSGSASSVANADNRPEFLSGALSLLEMACRLMEEAGAADRVVRLRDLMQSEKSLRQAHDFFFRSSELGAFSFNVQSSEQVEQGEYPALFVSTLVLGEDVYAYGLKLALVVEKTDEGYVFRSTSMVPLHISWIEDNKAALDKFAAHTAKLSGTRITILPNAAEMQDLAAPIQT